MRQARRVHAIYVQPDPVIVFQDDCRYERVDFPTGAKEIHERKIARCYLAQQG